MTKDGGRGRRARRMAARAAMMIVCATACGLAVAGMAVAAPGRAAAGWKIQSTPDVRGAEFNFLAAVSCPSVSVCVAVGESRLSLSHHDQGLAERWTGTRWILQSTPNPAGKAIDLNGVSCPSASVCVAVGFEASSTSTVTLAERWTAGHWAIQPTPNPPGVTQSFLYGVSCSAAAACTGIGYDINASGRAVPLAERWNGQHWAIQAMPAPRGAQDTTPTGVSCPSATACTAVGGYRNSKNQRFTIAERWNGKLWAIQPTPNLAGVPATELATVSCRGTNCTAAGQFLTASSHTGAVVEHWNGTKWLMQALPHVAGDSVLADVSCPAAATCTAVGWTTKGIAQTPILAERWNGSHWAVQPAPNPPGDEGTAAGLSCPTAATCTAVGSYVTSTGRVLTFAEHE
jgi:hypothetical protein